MQGSQTEELSSPRPVAAGGGDVISCAMAQCSGEHRGAVYSWLDPNIDFFFFFKLQSGLSLVCCIGDLFPTPAHGRQLQPALQWVLNSPSRLWLTTMPRLFPTQSRTVSSQEQLLALARALRFPQIEF